MEIVRNFINVAGLADENDLPDKVNGQLIQYSEIDTIFIPDNQPDVKSIFQIMIKVEVCSSKRIKTPTGYTVIIDGVKKLKIIYTQNDASGKAVFLDLELPYNTYVELPDYIEIENINVLILDAFFNLLDKRRIYSHLLYMVNVSTTSTDPSNASSIPEKSSDNQQTNIKKTISISNPDNHCIVEENKPTCTNLENKVENKLEKESVEILIDIDAEYL